MQDAIFDFAVHNDNHIQYHQPINMTEELYKHIWQLSAKVQQQDAYNELTTVTKQLIDIYAEQGRLDVNPFDTAVARSLSLPFDEVNSILAGSICLVTGGLGCVGTILVKELLTFDVARVIVLDIATSSADHFTDARVQAHVCDIRNEQQVMDLFAATRPTVVFHTAAHRNPGYAERHAHETFQTNVLGTLNLVNACEKTNSVTQCVFSSTGKASRYFTNEVYAQTKKLCEYIFDVYARTGRVLYAMARFTHIIDNSLMNDELEEASRNSQLLAIHSPGKYVTAQNAREAACLMISGLLYAEKGRCNFLIVRHLEWPVESLEVALYYISRSGRNIPVIFKGNPPGYTEKFFRGQLDWSHPDELNLLINVYEYQHKSLNKAEDMLISHICPVEADTLFAAIDQVKQMEDEKSVKYHLTEHLITLVKESLTHTNKQDTINILNWGIQKKYLALEKATVQDYGLTVPLLAESLEGTEYYQQVAHLFAEPVASNSFTH